MKMTKTKTSNYLFNHQILPQHRSKTTHKIRNKQVPAILLIFCKLNVGFKIINTYDISSPASIGFCNPKNKYDHKALVPIELQERKQLLTNSLSTSIRSQTKSCGHTHHHSKLPPTGANPIGWIKTRFYQSRIPCCNS
jgi:hypothetical protein